MTEETKKNALQEECGCDCGCSHDHGEELADEEDDDIVELVDDDGKTLRFAHVATVDYEDNWYVFFAPAEDIDGMTDEEVVIFKLDADEDGGEVFTPIEDEALLQRVYDEYVRRMEEDDEGCEGGCDSSACGCGCEGCSPKK
jgi:uncharacterized protein YrzB (UPF0473 family)